jgi:hypothetical protein
MAIYVRLSYPPCPDGSQMFRVHCPLLLMLSNYDSWVIDQIWIRSFVIALNCIELHRMETHWTELNCILWSYSKCIEGHGMETHWDELNCMSPPSATETFGHDVITVVMTVCNSWCYEGPRTTHWNIRHCYRFSNCIAMNWMTGNGNTLNWIELHIMALFELHWIALNDLEWKHIEQPTETLPHDIRLVLIVCNSCGHEGPRTTPYCIE